MPWLETIKFDANGLVPVVAQDVTTGEVLMLAYADRTALEQTALTRTAHYWSRSRKALWKKGESSGNVQILEEIRVDCDGDSILYRVRQTGPACHTGNPSCFFRLLGDSGFVEASPAGNVLTRIDAVVADRMANPVEGSYTTYLFEQGLDKILKKVGEEATEVVIASKNDDADELASETADLLFHLIVLLRERALPLTRIWAVMEERFGRAPRERGHSRTKE
jgi:phosphoribosyl-AMP cyclohydrolase / phosphoribosyl-ATP pyrophosphohydrolase